MPLEVFPQALVRFDYVLWRILKVINFILWSINWEKNPTFVDGKKKFYPEAYYQQMKVVSQGEVKRQWSSLYYHTNVGRKNLIWSTSHFQSFQIVLMNNCLLISNSSSISDDNPKKGEEYLWQYLYLDSTLHLSRYIPCKRHGARNLISIDN